jgi:hypothetical protein
MERMPSIVKHIDRRAHQPHGRAQTITQVGATFCVCDRSNSNSKLTQLTSGAYLHVVLCEVFFVRASSVRCMRTVCSCWGCRWRAGGDFIVFVETMIEKLPKSWGGENKPLFI